MATDDTIIDPASETADQAPSQTDDSPTSPEPTDDIERLKQERDAALNEAKTWKGRVEKLNATKKKEPTEKTEPNLDLDEVDFRIQHKDELAIYGQRVSDLRAKGLDRDEALRIARLEHDKSTPVEAEAQAAASVSAPIAHRSSSTVTITPQEAQDMAVWGFSKETLEIHKKIKQERARRA